jgi:hypothetical protein
MMSFWILIIKSFALKMMQLLNLIGIIDIFESEKE